MADSSGAISGPADPADKGAAGMSLVARRIGASIQSPPPPPPPPPGTHAAASVLADGLDRMRSRADLFGFVIAPRRPVLGMRDLKRLLRRLQAQTFGRQSEFNAAATTVAELLASEEFGARRSVHAQAEALTRAEERIAGLERRLLEAEAEIAALRQRCDSERP
ncbi:MAG: hypothetical protein WAU75_09575 [Solirubrobacteraceae bacterium]